MHLKGDTGKVCPRQGTGISIKFETYMQTS